MHSANVGIVHPVALFETGWTSDRLLVQQSWVHFGRKTVICLNYWLTAR
jgi:hypothetical protein